MDEMAKLGLKYRYARLAGEIEMLRAANLRIESEIDRLNKIHASNQARIEKLGVEVEAVGTASALVFRVDLTGTASRKTIPKAHDGSWGSTTRTILKQLRCAAGAPLTTLVLAEGLASELGLGNEVEMARLKKAAKYCLKRLAVRGVVIRVGKDFQKQRYTSWVIADFVG